MSLAARVLLTWFTISVVTGPFIGMLLTDHCQPVARVPVASRRRAIRA